MKSKFSLQPGNELRGFNIRLYPSKDVEEKLLHLETDMRRAWNWLVNQTEEVLKAREAFALKQNLVAARPSQPCYDGLTPEEAKSLKEKTIADFRDWYKSVYDATNKIPECQFRTFKQLLDHYGFKNDYQLMSRVIDWKYEDYEQERIIVPCAHSLQSLVKNYFTKGKNQKRKKFRKASDSMP